MHTDQLDYALPPDRIATEPAEPRDAARLMVAYRGEDRLVHARVRDLPDLGVLRAGDLLVVNRTRVLPAYFEATRRGTGGRIRALFLEEPRPGVWSVMLESRGRLRPGEHLTLPQDAGELELLEPQGRGRWAAQVTSDLETLALLERVGSPPLPPYIRKARRHLEQAEIGQADVDRYNTVYAADAGSVAAPTAGLHFTPSLLERLETMGVRRAEVTLRVGPGTFEPIRTDTLAEHRMHAESIRVPAETVAAIRTAREEGRRIIPVGTTTVRALESLPDPLGRAATGYEGDTRLFIHPDAGFRFRFTDALMTNFHLPRSTLLAMIASLPGVGLDRLKAWYQTAALEGYRFYSYGDAMLIV